MVTPASRKPVVRYMIEHHGISERAACRLAGVSRTGFRYVAKPSSDDVARERLKELAEKYKAYGYLLLHALLKREGLVVNRKHTYRLYREEGLQVRTKKRKRLYRARVELPKPTGINQQWAMDFVADQLINGRRFRVLNVTDNFNRELVGQLVAFSISGERVARFLSQLRETRALPERIVVDNGTEFTSKVMFEWTEGNGTKLQFIQLGKPTQNAFVESLNGKFRNECLNQHWFRSLDEATQTISDWREHYNAIRPHSSLGYLPPLAFAQQAA